MSDDKLCILIVMMALMSLGTLGLLIYTGVTRDNCGFPAIYYTYNGSAVMDTYCDSFGVGSYNLTALIPENPEYHMDCGAACPWDTLAVNCAGSCPWQKPSMVFSYITVILLFLNIVIALGTGGRYYLDCQSVFIFFVFLTLIGNLVALGFMIRDVINAQWFLSAFQGLFIATLACMVLLAVLQLIAWWPEVCGFILCCFYERVEVEENYKSAFRVDRSDPYEAQVKRDVKIKCPECDGAGFLLVANRYGGIKDDCDHCHGAGEVWASREYTVTKYGKEKTELYWEKKPRKVWRRK